MTSKIFFLLFICAAADVTFEPTADTNGIILTRVDEISVTTKNWKVCVIYDLKPFKAEIKRIKSMLSTLQILCNKISNNDTSHVCSMVTNQMNLHTLHTQNREAIIDATTQFTHALAERLSKSWAH